MPWVLEVWRLCRGTNASDGDFDDADANRTTLAPRGIFPSRTAVFSAGGHLSPWVPLLHLLGRYIEMNPGPPTYICRLCNQIINKRQTSVLCNYNSKHWIHSKCSGIRLRDYNPSFTCTRHRDQNQDSDSDNPTSPTTPTTSSTDSDGQNSPDSPHSTHPPPNNIHSSSSTSPFHSSLSLPSLPTSPSHSSPSNSSTSSDSDATLRPPTI